MLIEDLTLYPGFCSYPRGGRDPTPAATVSTLGGVALSGILICQQVRQHGATNLIYQGIDIGPAHQFAPLLDLPQSQQFDLCLDVIGISLTAPIAAARAIGIAGRKCGSDQVGSRRLAAGSRFVLRTC